MLAARSSHRQTMSGPSTSKKVRTGWSALARLFRHTARRTALPTLPVGQSVYFQPSSPNIFCFVVVVLSDVRGTLPCRLRCYFHVRRSMRRTTAVVKHHKQHSNPCSPPSLSNKGGAVAKTCGEAGSGGRGWVWRAPFFWCGRGGQSVWGRA